MPALLVDLGGTHLRCGVWRESSQAKVLERSRIQEFGGDRPDARIWDRIVRAITTFACSAQGLLPDSAPMIISVPGPVVERSRLVDAPTVIGAETAIPDLRSILSEKIGRPVHILNDISAAAWHLSRRVNAARFMVVTVSSGIGSKIFDRRHSYGVLDDIPYAGEIGHVKVDEAADAPLCDCGGKGHLGAISSGRGIERYARAVMPNKFLTNELHLVPAARRGDDWALEIIRHCTEPLARVLLQTVIAAGVERVVIIGGFALELGPVYRTLLQEEISKRCDYRVASGSMNDLIMLGDGDSCLLGTAAYAQQLA